VFNQQTQSVERYFNNVTTLLIDVLSTYKYSITEVQLSNVANAVSPYICRIESSSFLNALTENYAKTFIPGNQLFYSEKISLIRYRLLSSDLKGLNIEFNFRSVSLPEKLQIDDFLVYDLAIENVYCKGSDQMQISLNASGSYINDTLVLYNKSEQVAVLLDSLLKFKLKNSLVQEALCVGYDQSVGFTKNCYVTTTNNSYVEAEANFFAVFTVVKANSDCEIRNNVAFALCALLILPILLIGILDRNQAAELNLELTLSNSYSVMALLHPQSKNVRILKSLHLFSSLLLLLAITPGKFLSFNIFAITYSADFISDSTTMPNLFIPLAALQIYTFISYVLHMKAINSSAMLKCYFIISALCIGFSLATTIVSCTSTCATISENWIISFFMLSIIQMFVLELIYAAVIIMLTRKCKKAKVSSEESGSDLDITRNIQESPPIQASSIISTRMRKNRGQTVSIDGLMEDKSFRFYLSN
jgi:hypothetical protein